MRKKAEVKMINGVDSRKGHLNEETFHTIIETLKHGYAIRSGLGLVLDVFESDFYLKTI